ncbi:hypothetical protein RoPhREQ3_gp03 [Rhodococcus phage REQ3]|uniref:Uncharacterized protein n=1 Tax=Rhodococcus phage REQ3 TaxID=1109714 RepID=G9FH50_9CAUD|nr:hypothetical protein RoPhREQ3_gp03 [Rhodococcus phage REQ3]AEV51939.1 hypothetical protein [Rhodococcus phage REQ3]
MAAREVAEMVSAGTEIQAVQRGWPSTIECSQPGLTVQSAKKATVAAPMSCACCRAVSPALGMAWMVEPITTSLPISTMSCLRTMRWVITPCGCSRAMPSTARSSSGGRVGAHMKYTGPVELVGNASSPIIEQPIIFSARNLTCDRDNNLKRGSNGGLATNK